MNVTSVIDNPIPGFSEEDPAYSDYTPVNVAKGNGDSYVVAKSDAYLHEQDSDLVVAHEFGHLFGLDDRYDEVGTFWNRKTKPQSGWTGNIMAEVNPGSKVEERNIDGILNTGIVVLLIF